MSNRICSVPDCGGKHEARGWCANHYQKWKRSGDPRGTFKHDPVQRFWSKVEKTDTCWNWTAGLTRLESNGRGGYGQYWAGKHGKKMAHRFAYEVTNGPIPAGMDIDHLCHNHRCVNPDHLRPVTNKQNHENLRGALGNSQSGVRGVSLCSMTGRWIGYVGHHGKHYNVGRFDTVAEAEAAVIARRNKLFTHNDLDRGESVA